MLFFGCICQKLIVEALDTPEKQSSKSDNNNERIEFNRPHINLTNKKGPDSRP